MINRNNYFERTAGMDFGLMPEGLQEGHSLLLEATENGSTWDYYEADPEIKESIELHFAALNKYIEKKGAKPAIKTESAKPVQKRAPVPKPEPAKRAVKEQAAQPVTEEVLYTERIPEELKFVKRFINLDGKVKSKDEILSFIRALQKAIIEKRIRKSSPYAKEITLVQEKLVKLYNGMRGKALVKLQPCTVDELKILTGGEKVMPAVALLKKYILLNGKTGIKDKARKLAEQFTRAAKSDKVSGSGPYSKAFRAAWKNLIEYSKNSQVKTLRIEKAELNGLNGLLNGANGLDGIAVAPNGVRVMNSMDFVKLKFDRLGFTGKWLFLIGDPSPGFTIMVFGIPKFGKSCLCVELANYLAAHFGTVYYAAREEGLDRTFQDKFIETNMNHPNLTVADGLVEDLSPYDFIFLDSVTALGLKPDDLNTLKRKWPGKSFIYVFQTTKAGDFRGQQGFMHDVDAIIEVPELGKAIQRGRFNSYGEMEITKLAA